MRDALTVPGGEEHSYHQRWRVEAENSVQTDLVKISQLPLLFIYLSCFSVTVSLCSTTV